MIEVGQVPGDVELSVVALALLLLFRATGLVSAERPGRWKLFALTVVTLWGLRLTYWSQSWLALANLGAWLLIYSSISDDDGDADGHDHGHGHGHGHED